MTPEPKLIRIRRGGAWTQRWRLLDSDDEASILAGCTATLKFFGATGTEPLVDATCTVNEDLTGDDAGTVDFELTEEQVAEFDALRVGHWIFEITDSLTEPHTATGPFWMEDAT